MTPEFSRLVPLARLGRDRLRLEIAATDSERDGLARRLGLVTLDRLAAAVELRRQADATIRLNADFAAEFTQECVLTLEPVAGAVAQRFALVYGPPGAAPDDRDAGDDEPAFEPLTGDAIDIGEAVAQELSLALPEFPRHPDAAIDAAGPEEAADPRFAALARLKSLPQG